MSTVNLLVQQLSDKTESNPESVRYLIGLALKHIPAGARVDKASVTTALNATRKDVQDTEHLAILDSVEKEFNSMGMLKRTVAFSILNSNIEAARSELK